ncbi:guanine nucleotide-binding protein g(o) subunit alpha [Anaeramoeba ignava]|uniref:Guanine nucleotide-binding protein g(O) subunit alpha n=1 Tax=Anaeramoeba ignava TaxID=1746090 RepID=A0A9Q0L9B2_ANAIG|nr:guanine nucleotide-binding protein g(o) subunit alpha [Anaeramoeba ignava]
MGNKPNKKVLNEHSKNQKIEQQIKEEEEMFQKEVKLLLLGTGESGKTTFIKQIQILYNEGFNDSDRLLYFGAIRANIIVHIKTLLKASKDLGIPIKPENEVLATEFLEFDEFTKEVGQKAKILWSDPALKSVYELRNEFYVPDTTDYFLDNVDRVSADDFVPKERDILNCRIPTTGVKSISFMVNQIPWKVVDVGGQRSERRKWIHQFSGVSFLIFVIAMSEYDQQLFEDRTKNRMQESMELFHSTANNKFFRSTHCILLFNKIDLFQQKLSKSEFSLHFPDYSGVNNVEEIMEFIKNKFIQPVENKERKIYCHFTCATNTQDIQKVFNSLQTIVFEQRMNDTGVF